MKENSPKKQRHEIKSEPTNLEEEKSKKKKQKKKENEIEIKVETDDMISNLLSQVKTKYTKPISSKKKKEKTLMVKEEPISPKSSPRKNSILPKILPKKSPKKPSKSKTAN